MEIFTVDYSSAFTGNGNNGGTGQPPAGIDAFDGAEPAPEYTPLPPGIYQARVVLGEYCTTRKGDDAYKVRFAVTEGPHAGRTVTRVWTFSAKALAYSKRDLSALGLTTSAQLLTPFPPPGREVHVKLVVVLQRGDDGQERNDIRRVDLVRVVESPVAAFLLPPAPQPSEGGQP